MNNQGQLPIVFFPTYNPMHKQPLLSLNTRLAILQQAEYEWQRYELWIDSQQQEVEIEPKAWTIKLRLFAVWTTMLAPIFGTDAALHIINSLFAFPQFCVTEFIIVLATVKLRLMQLFGTRVVSIAGSYAKTSTKHLIAHIVKKKLRTAVTPGNINTRFGIARFILTQVPFATQALVVELGEYNPGDIHSFARLLHAQIVVLTPIGIAHLERFRSEDALQNEFLDHLRKNPSATAIIHEKNTSPTSTVLPLSFHFYGDDNIHNVQVSRSGTECELTIGKDTYHAYSQLLGKHNMINAVAALLVGQELGLSVADMLHTLGDIPQMQYRMETQLLEHNILTINNGYNSNPASAPEALAVLDAIDGTQKIVITPGFVELGDRQASANATFAGQIAKVADLVVIVRGANQQSLREGFEKVKYSKQKLIEADTEIEAMQKITANIKPGAVILFENSLTDVYKTHMEE